MSAEAIQLMQRYVDGDAAAFRALYALLAPKLLGYLAKMTRDRAVADDLLQQTFLKVHRARGAWVPGADPTPWIYAIAHRTFLDEARRRKRWRARHSDEEHPPEPAVGLAGTPVDDGPAPGEDGFSPVTLEALKQLPQSQREALLLTKVHGHSVAEAAAITGSTAGAVKLRAHRAYVTLRKILRKESA